MDFGGRLEHNINLKGWNSQAHRDVLGIFPESWTRAMLVGTMLVGRLGVRHRDPSLPQHVRERGEISGLQAEGADGRTPVYICIQV